jgi:ATP dependent DNA ligase C terminal region
LHRIAFVFSHRLKSFLYISGTQKPRKIIFAQTAGFFLSGDHAQPKTYGVLMFVVWKEWIFPPFQLNKSMGAFLIETRISTGCRRPYSVREPQLVAHIEFTEWTPDGHLRHSKFVGLREDKEAGGVVRESGS